MSLKDSINAYEKSPTYVVEINGKKINNVLSVEISHSIQDSLSECTVTYMDTRSINPEDKIVVRQGYDGSTNTTFTGFIDANGSDAGERVVTIRARDVLKKAMDTYLVQEIKFGLDINTETYYYSTYSNIDGGTFTIHEYSSLAALNSSHPETNGNYTNEGVKAEAVVQWMLVMTGLREGSEIQVNPTNFFIGDISPVTFHLTNVYDAIQQICELIGWRVYADPGGTVHFTQRPRNRSSKVYWSYFEDGDDGNIHSISKERTNTDLRNYVEVRGASGIRFVARSTSPYIGNTPYRGVLISNELIDTPEMASYTARRVLTDLNRLKETVSMEADGNPFLVPALTVSIDSSVADGYYVIEEISTSMSSENGYTMQMTLTTYPGDVSPDDRIDYGTVTPTFTYNVSLETITSGIQIAELFLDASNVFSSAPVTSYLWTNNYDSQTASGQSAMMFFNPAPSGMDVTLYVTDELGASGTITQQVLISGAAYAGARILSFAAGTSWYVSPDAGYTWNSAELESTTVVPPIGPTNNTLRPEPPSGIFTDGGIGLMANGGAFGGILYTSNDYLQTSFLDIKYTDPINTIQFIWQNEGFPERVMLALGNEIILTENAGSSWIPIEAPGEVSFVLENPTLPGNFEILVGNKVYWSTTSGEAWDEVLAGPLGSIASYYTSGQDKHWVSFTGVTSGAVVRSVEGDSIFFSQNASPSGLYDVSSITAMTMAINRPELYVFDDRGGVWICPVVGGDARFSCFLPGEYPNNVANHAIRDPELDIVYVATNGGLVKYFPLMGSGIVMKECLPGEVGYMVGYDGTPGRRVKAEIIVGTASAENTRDGIWHYKDGAWLKKTPPLPDIKWQIVRGRPKSPDHWVILGTSGSRRLDDIPFPPTNLHIYETLDAGGTWQELAFNFPAFNPWSSSEPIFTLATVMGMEIAEDGTIYLFGVSGKEDVNSNGTLWVRTPGTDFFAARLLATGPLPDDATEDSNVGQIHNIFLGEGSKIYILEGDNAGTNTYGGWFILPSWSSNYTWTTPRNRVDLGESRSFAAGRFGDVKLETLQMFSPNENAFVGLGARSMSVNPNIENQGLGNTLPFWTEGRDYSAGNSYTKEPKNPENTGLGFLRSIQIAEHGMYLASEGLVPEEAGLFKNTESDNLTMEFLPAIYPLKIVYNMRSGRGYRKNVGAYVKTISSIDGFYVTNDGLSWGFVPNPSGWVDGDFTQEGETVWSSWDIVERDVTPSGILPVAPSGL